MRQLFRQSPWAQGVHFLWTWTWAVCITGTTAAQVRIESPRLPTERDALNSRVFRQSNEQAAILKLKMMLKLRVDQYMNDTKLPHHLQDKLLLAGQGDIARLEGMLEDYRERGCRAFRYKFNDAGGVQLEVLDQVQYQASQEEAKRLSALVSGQIFEEESLLKKVLSMHLTQGADPSEKQKELVARQITTKIELSIPFTMAQRRIFLVWAIDRMNGASESPTMENQLRRLLALPDKEWYEVLVSPIQWRCLNELRKRYGIDAPDG
jgi:hypothetical protein